MDGYDLLRRELVDLLEVARELLNRYDALREFENFKDALLEALKDFPEARARLLERLDEMGRN